MLGWRGAAQSHHYQLYRDVLRARPRRAEVGRLIEAIEDVMTSECSSDSGVEISLHCPMPIFERAVRRHPGHQVCPGLGRMVK